MYEKIMYKVESKDNKLLYRLQDFTKNDNVDESVFIEERNTKGAKRLQCKVKVLHENEYEAIIEELEDANLKVEELNNKIMRKNLEIKRLQGEIAKEKRANIDENLQLYDDKFNMLQTYADETRLLEKQHQNKLDELNETYSNQLSTIDESHKETLKTLSAQYTRKLDDANERLLNEVKENDKARDKLKGEMSDMRETLQREHHKELEKIQHTHSDELQALREQHTYDITQLKEAIATIKQEHLIEVNEIEQRHNTEVNEIRGTFLKMLSVEHAQDLSELKECEDVPFYVKPFIKAHLQALDEFKQRKYMNTPQRIIETYELAGEKKKEQ